MFIDALDLNGQTYLHINVRLVSLLGLHAAAYCSEALAIIRRAVGNEHSSSVIKDADGQPFVKIDRKYIQSRIGLTPNEQSDVENLLEGNSLLFRHPTIANAIMLDGKRLVSMIVGSEDLGEDFGTAPANLQPAKPKATKKAARGKLLKNIASRIEARTDLDSDLSKALLEWAGELLKYRLVSFKMVDTFIADILSYNDKDKALKVVTTAASYGLPTAEEAAAKLLYKTNIAEEMNNTTLVKKGSIRKFKHERATKDDLGEDDF